VLVGRGCLGALGQAMAARLPLSQAVVCCDENVAPLYLSAVREDLIAAGFAVSQIVIPAGERQKTLARAEELYGVLYDRGLRRTDTLVALGGGVIGDLTGFVAATYQRGLHFVQAPTTLLAQVDASIGGKVGVDFRAGKNYVGAFFQPHLVCADLQTLASLPRRELHSGAAEVAKYALAAGGELLAAAQHLAAAPLTAEGISVSLVAACVGEKLSVVAADEREESGARALLNLGHTIGHAIEAATAFARYSHGEAVGLGLRAALRLSQRLCGLSAGEAARGAALLDGLGLPSRLEGVDAELICDLTRRDKKAGKDGVGYVLLAALGAPVLGVAVPRDIELEAVQWLLKH
jgi:3-dehydroquinate synthase